MPLQPIVQPVRHTVQTAQTMAMVLSVIAAMDQTMERKGMEKNTKLMLQVSLQQFQGHPALFWRRCAARREWMYSR